MSAACQQASPPWSPFRGALSAVASGDVRPLRARCEPLGERDREVNRLDKGVVVVHVRTRRAIKLRLSGGLRGSDPSGRSSTYASAGRWLPLRGGMTHGVGTHRYRPTMGPNASVVPDGLAGAMLGGSVTAAAGCATICHEVHRGRRTERRSTPGLRRVGQLRQRTPPSRLPRSRWDVCRALAWRSRWQQGDRGSGRGS